MLSPELSTPSPELSMSPYQIDLDSLPYTYMSGDIQEHLQLRTARNLRIVVHQLLQVTLQGGASLVYQLLGQIARHLLRRQQIFTHSISFHQLTHTHTHTHTHTPHKYEDLTSMMLIRIYYTSVKLYPWHQKFTPLHENIYPCIKNSHPWIKNLMPTNNLQLLCLDSSTPSV